MPNAEDLYAGLLAVTREYLSDASVRAAVDTALRRPAGPAQVLTVDNLPETLAEAMVGLRLFCKPEKFGDLMMDLTEYCGLLSADSQNRSTPKERKS